MIIFKTIIALLIPLTLTSCIKPVITYQGDWTGTGKAIVHNDFHPDEIDSTGLTINFDNVKLTITQDTFEITGLDKKLRGIVKTKEDPTDIDLLDFDSYEYEIFSQQDKLATKEAFTVQVTGGQPLTGESI